jgi:hypothetical protein
VRFNFDGSLLLEVIRVKNNIRLPLFSHITRVLEHGELHKKHFEWLDVQEGFNFWHFPRNKHNEDKELAKMEFIALILCFVAIQFKMNNKVLLPIHLYTFYALPCKVNDKSYDLCGSVLLY